MITTQDVVRVARSMIGVPFRHQGRSRVTGVDCVGLAIVTLQELGAVPRPFEIMDYARHPNGGELGDRIEKHCTPLPAATPGALVAVRWKKELAHVAIVGRDDNGMTLIHAYSRRNSVIEHGLRGRWFRYVDSAWALPGVCYG
jgi:cell wall-associated NlpC family hydrolase